MQLIESKPFLIISFFFIIFHSINVKLQTIESFSNMSYQYLFTLHLTSFIIQNSLLFLVKTFQKIFLCDNLTCHQNSIYNSINYLTNISFILKIFYQSYFSTYLINLQNLKNHIFFRFLFYLSK